MSVGDLQVRAEYLDEAAVAALLARRQADYADPAEAAQAQTAFLLWSLGEERYATPLADVREVAPVPRIAPVPGAPAKLLGVVAWRGIIHNLFDPAAVLGGARSEGGYMLVLRHDRPRIALRVSAISAASAPLPAAEDDALTRFAESGDGTRFALVSTSLLIEQLLARPGAREG